MTVAFPLMWVYIIYAALGLVLGLALERGRMCFVSAFRDAMYFRNPWLLNAVLISIGASAVATAAVSLETGSEPLLLGTGWYVLVGGLLFGFGVALAGACASGMLFRIPEGYTANLVELGGFSAGILFWAAYLEVPLAGGYGPPVSIPQQLGLPFWSYALLSGAAFLILGAYLARYVPQRGGASQTRWTIDPRRAWDPRVAGLLVAAVQVTLFVVTPNALLGFTAPYATFGAVTLEGLGVNMRSVPWVGGSYLDVYPLLVLTLAAFVGGGIGAVAGHDFRVRVPRKPVRLFQSLAGGTVAGLGAGLGLGCNIGNLYAGLGLRMDVASLLFAPGLIAGIYLGVKVGSRL